MLALARPLSVFAVTVVLCFATGCARHAPSQAPPPAILAPVAPLPKPAALPAMIAAVAPTGDTDTLAQVRIRFSDDVIPLAQLESPAETAILAHFSLEPALPGRFRFLTPRMVGFEADHAWPPATRVRVRIAKGLSDLRGRALDQDVDWTFQTPAIVLGDLPGSSDDNRPRELLPRITFSSNVALDRASLEAHARVRAENDQGAGIALVVPPNTGNVSPTPSPAPDGAFDPSQRTWRYVLVPASALANATAYRVVIAPGVLPRTGNRPTERAFTGSFRTYDALRFDGVATSPPGTRFVDGDPKLAFSTPIDPASLGALALAPAPPRGVKAFAVVDGGVGIAPSLLTPGTDYTVTIGTELRDRFGQYLATAQLARFHTGDLVPDLWAPSGPQLFPANSDVRLNVVAVNAPPDVRAAFRAVRPADVVQFPDPYGPTDRNSILAPSAGWPRFDAGGPRNVERTIEVPLRAKLAAPAGVLAYGVAGNLGGEEPFVASGAVQLTNLGVFAQWFPDGGTVRVNAIADGAPVPGARVEVYPSQAQLEKKTAPLACAAGSTDAAGVAHFGSGGFASCAAHDGGENQAPAFVTIVRKAADWTYVRSDDSSGAYAGAFFNGWSSATPLSRGTIFSDRALYQPGETAQLTAVGWFLVDGVLRRGAAPSYGIVLEQPDGHKRDLGRRILGAFGTVSFPVTLPKNAPLGSYLVRASAGNGERLIGDFRVAEFKPPNFKVDLALNREVAQRGNTVSGTAMNAYLFGAPLTGATTAFTVTRSPAEFTPKGREAFTFGRRWFWPEEPPDAATDVLQTTASVDADGKSDVGFPIAADLPYAMSYRVDAETTDASNVSVADSKTVTALPSATLIGIKADDVGTAGTPLTIAAIATDASGKAQPGTKLHLELQAANYASATQIVEGAEQAVQSVTYATIASTDVTTGETGVNAALTPPKPGTYRLSANLSGASDEGAETDVQVWVGGSGETAWYAQDPNLLTVKLDKSTYAPGETATALVQSPFPTAEVHFAVVRHGVLWETTQRTTSAAPTVRFTVTPQMLPNAALEAFVVRRGAPPKSAPAGGGNALARAGFAPFAVALNGKYVAVAVNGLAGSLAPGAQQTVRVHLTGPDQRPLRGQATVIVANDAVLQLTGYRPPDLVKTVYAEQPISTRYADNRSALVLTTPAKPEEKGWGYGGGLSGEEADPRIRRRFEPLAYFAGAVQTDANGDASVSFTLPDDLTTWRAMVVAASADGSFGNGETTFRTTKPLVANPAFPQFARPGDRFEGGVAVTNGSGARGTLHIDAAFAGPLAFLPDGKPVPGTTLETPLDRSTKAYRFPVLATGTGTATATVRAGASGFGDAFAIPLPVRDDDVVETVAQTGTTDGRASVALDVAPETPRDAGGLEVALASSLIPEAGVAADAALRGDERLALSAASRLAVASDLAVLRARSGGDPGTARERAVQEIANLRDLRRADGGFAAYWQAEASAPWDSMTALAALGRAHDAGIAVDPALVDGARAYAAKILADPTGHEKWCSSDLCKAELRLAALDALAAAGDRRTTFLSEIDAQRDHLTFADQARLARLLTQAPGFAACATTLAKTIEDHLYATARGAVVTLPVRYRWIDSPVVAQAEALRLEIVRRADGETLDRLTRSLLDLRRNGSFGCACQTAAALGALVELAAHERSAAFTASVTLGTRTLAQERFSGTRSPLRTTSVAMRDLPAGRSDVTLVKDGSGTLHYAVTYRYRLAGAAPGRLAGLRVSRVVRPANTTTVLGTIGLAAPVAALELPVARVFDVELQVISDHPVDRVLITDPLPAGLEAVDTSFATTSPALTTPSAPWQISDQRIRTDRIEAYADRLDPGIYRLHYLARSVTPGTFAWPGADAHLVDRQEEFGRSAASTVVVR